MLCVAQHSLVKLDYPINTESLDEICPIVSYDERLLFFTRVGDTDCEKTLWIDSFDVFQTLEEPEYLEKLKFVYSQIASKPVTEPFKSEYNQDIWYTNLINKIPSGIFHPGFPINDVLPNSICSNFGINNSYLVINQFAPFGGIEKGFSVTEKNSDNFSFPIPIQVQDFDVKSNEVNVSASLDSTILILSLQQSDSIENLDLFVCFKLRENIYSQPISMGNQINTDYRESTPMLTHDTKRLYFTSDRPGGYGGKDIYFSDRLDFTYTMWSAPKYLNPPVNTAFNDAHPHLLKDNNTIFFTSNRTGSSDIFRAFMIRNNLSSKMEIIIKIINAETNNLMAGELYWGDAYSDTRDGYFRSRDGLCRYNFFTNKPIGFKASNRNFSSEETIIDPQDMVNKGINSDTLYLMMYPEGKIENKAEISIKPPEVINKKISELDLNNSIMLQNIYFAQSKSTVLPQSFASINKLAKVLLSRPLLYIRIIGHTDNVGDKDALKILSENRAKAIKEMLEEAGIASDRIDTFGYGDTRPLAPNNTEENKSKNRRVEIKILSQ